MTDDITPSDKWSELAARMFAETDPDKRAALIDAMHEAYLAEPRAVTGAGYPYPQPTDPVAQGADAIRSLANAAGMLRGIKVCTNSGLQRVDFPVGYFTAPPVVVCLAMVPGTVSYAYMSEAPTAVYFTVRLFTNGGAQVAGSAHWIAAPVVPPL